MQEDLFDSRIQHFTIESHKVTLTCNRLALPGTVAYKVSFSSDRQPLVVARAMGENKGHFWTSIPEGRQKEAEGVGKLIEEYLKTLK